MATFTEGLCEKLQSRLIDIATTASPALKRDSVGLFDSLVSDRNTAGTEQIPIDTGDGKIREVKLKYYQRSTMDDTTDDPEVSLCETTREETPKEKIIKPEMYRATKLMFTEAEMRKLCEADSEWVNQILLGQLNAMANAIEFDLVTKAATLFGKYGGQTDGSVNGVTQNNAGSGYTSAPQVTISGGGGTGAQAVAVVVGGAVVDVVITDPGTGYTSPPSITFSGGGGTGADYDATIQANADSGNAPASVPWLLDQNSVNALVQAKFLEKLTDSGVNGSPFVIGQGKLAEVMRMLNVGCCNQWGANIANIGGDMDFYRSRHVGQVLGDPNAFIALEPHAAQFITYNEYVGTYRKQTPTLTMGTLTDPFTGITYDLKAMYDECAEVWIFSLKKKFDLWVLPDNAYKTTDYLNGVNGLMKFIAK
jgi:hypothetical protein